MRTAGACSLLVHLLLYLQTIQLIPIHGITSQADSRSVVLSFPESRDNVASRSSILESGQWALSLCKIVATPLKEQPMIKRTSWTHRDASREQSGNPSEVPTAENRFRDDLTGAATIRMV
ncbi:hypothetical protein KC19_10G154700 [Ceratodon purpureus]|uniref:Secreted protein n=1 Tax=Ceratodon purpureus TaxID=3225 RepID=A0A8T0GNN5_CERPU|nr:hypothetical protein KC19_10G154700 [Ceratodon purpureus]